MAAKIRLFHEKLGKVENKQGGPGIAAGVFLSLKQAFSFVRP